MNTKQSTRRKKKPYGPNIVRAWFDTVFYYSLAGLERERGFLVRRNWTFRFRDATLEYLGPLAAHLPTAARENLEQFVSFFPEASARITDHDGAERQLEQNCRTYFEAILNHPHFRAVFESVGTEAPQALGREFSSHFGAYSSDTDFMGILAEYLVNNVETLPSHYSTAELWNHYRDRFLPVVLTPELAPFRETTTQAGQALLKAVEDLTSSLKSIRSELSLEFDVPYVAELNSVR